MPINNITQTISTIPEAAHRGVDVQTVFVTKQEDFQDHLVGTTVTELNTLKDQLNTRIGEINSTTTTMNGYADTASAGASTATTKAGEASTSASEALTSRNQAETFKNNASASATKASQWADNNYNVEVETGKYSAKHWAVVAENATSGKIDKVTSTDNAIVRFDGTTGEVQNSGVVINDSGNVGIGTSSPIGKLHIVSKVDGEAFRVQRAGGTNLTLLRVNINESSNTATIEATAAAGNTSLNFATAGYERLRIDSTGNVLAVSPTGGLGYGTGSGGTVTQLTSKSTSVTLNKPSGSIIMNNTALIPNSKVSFLLYNSLIASTDNIILSVVNGSTVLAQYEARGRCSDNIAEIIVSHTYNSSLSEAIVLNFAIIKGANS